MKKQKEKRERIVLGLLFIPATIETKEEILEYCKKRHIKFRIDRCLFTEKGT